MTMEALHLNSMNDLNSSWEDKWSSGKTLPVTWKMAASFDLCSPKVQDMVYQNAHGVAGGRELHGARSCRRRVVPQQGAGTPHRTGRCRDSRCERNVPQARGYRHLE